MQVKVKVVDLLSGMQITANITRNTTPPPDGIDFRIVHEHFFPTDKVNIICLGNKFKVNYIERCYKTYFCLMFINCWFYHIGPL